jgi:hypothetical protein
VKIFGDWSEFKWELNRSELHIRNGTKFDDNFIDSSFVAGVRIDNSAKILNSLAVDETPSREVFHKILNLSCKIALDTVESERLDSFSREYDADDGETDGYFYYSNPFRITGLKPEKQKMVHKSTLKAVSDIKQILQESWPCVHSDLKDLLQAIEEPRRKLMETTPESP